MKPAGGQSSLSPSSLTPPSSPLPSVPFQVKIFEEDFQRERSDRERMNEEKEELKKQVEKLQAQVTLSNAQVRAAGPRRGHPAWPHGAGGGGRVWIGGSRVRLEVRTPWFFQLCYRISAYLSESPPLSDLCLPPPPSEPPTLSRNRTKGCQ